MRIKKLVNLFRNKSPLLDDCVDRLYHPTVCLLLFYAFTIYWKQTFGVALVCATPDGQEAKGRAELRVNRCFENGTFVMENLYDLPQENEFRRVSLIWWYPYVLLFQAFFSYGPVFLWRKLLSSSALNFEMTLKLCMEAHESLDSSSSIALVSRIHDAQQFRKKSMKWFTCVYIFCKMLSVLNLIIQLVCMSAYIDMNKFTSPFTVYYQVLWRRNDYLAFKFFPLAVYCRFVVAELLDVYQHITECFLEINVLNRQTFIVTYLFFSGLLIITVLNLAYSICVLGFSSSFKNDLLEHCSTKSRADIDEVFDRDTRLLFHFICKNTDKQFALKLSDSHY
ncbi:Innexin [Aphelenchoides besseyi]|nr:Innexin [Aphelenchoides besseyi]